MVKREASTDNLNSPPKRRRRSSTSPLKEVSTLSHAAREYGPQWNDWPAPAHAMEEARDFIRDIVSNKRSVLIVPDKDADGLSAGTILYQTLIHMNHPPSLISVHHLTKGNNVHSDFERNLMDSSGAEKVVVLDQGSRPGRSIVPPLPNQKGKRVLVVDHHMSDEWPEGSQVLTACRSSPIATAALLTYLLLRDLHPKVHEEEAWRAVVGVIGDLGTSVPKWGTGPWPSELGSVFKKLGSKSFSEAVSGVNAPRRTAEYNVPKAWDIMLNSKTPWDLASNAFLKLCKMDVGDETAKWARTPPRFSKDGRVAVCTIHTAFQIHPVIATRWSGTLGRKSSKLLMVMCANTGFHADQKVSFSCRIASNLRSLPEGQQPNLIALLNEYADNIPGFRERVGGDYARGHKEATGGIIAKAEYNLLLEEMGVPQPGTTVKSENNGSSPSSPSPKKVKGKIIDPKQSIGGLDKFFKVKPKV
ncbi:uncharacterized protein IL334_000790 [Kwoniella shivajii]|uniref:DDH domain-containing protein n=1 Tax=Kwoniella shivajii TaxID=564305 RepID=A0ABZ1CQ43_9TREE|nr:hypothetical protein IL334_000790 [Kwoniella shivajii]